MDQLVQANAGSTAPEGLVFISYATADRQQARSVCKALERRGTACWIASRDVEPGDNYQEAIVRSIRGARAVVLVFSAAANSSDEIKKELSLASRYRVPVIAIRVEKVEPTDAFAYELSTRQWIDAFEHWDRSIEALIARISALPCAGRPHDAAAPVARRQREIVLPGKRSLVVAGGLTLLLIAYLAWVFLKPSAGPAQTMVVRLEGFRLLSADLPRTMPDTVREEVIGALGDDGVIRVSTATKPESGTGPAYLLGGTIRRDGATIRVITRLINERSGVALWIDTFDYDAKDLSRVPRRIAVDAGNMVHCGLFAASTYGKPLPDLVMSDYMKFCQNSWWSQQFSNPDKALDAAQKVAAAAPDFSWGWSAITVASELVFNRTPPGPRREEVRRLGLAAAEKALSLDPKNSEAYAQKSLLIGRLKWAEQEQLLQRAIAARPLFCGCEHYLYGVMLTNVGRHSDAVVQMRRSTELLALDGISQSGLADALLVTGSPEDAKTHFEAAIDLFRNPDTASYYSVRNATETGDYGNAIKALADPRLHMSEAKRAAILNGFKAVWGRGAGSHLTEITALTDLPESDQDSIVTRLLAALGADHEALQIVEMKALKENFAAASWLWYPSMRRALSSPEFLQIAERLGLMSYWRTARTKPDPCKVQEAPPFCRAI